MTASITSQNESPLLLLLHVLSPAGYWNGSLVAVKVLEQVAGDFNPRSNLEPLLHHRLSHPNIVAMFEVCTQVRTCHVHARTRLVACQQLRVWVCMHRATNSSALHVHRCHPRACVPPNTSCVEDCHGSRRTPAVMACSAR